jgi:threonine dehydratase
VEPVTLRPPSLEEIRAARSGIAPLGVVRTPLVRLGARDEPGEIYLKLETLQPIGSFKLRGAGNAMRLKTRGELARGVYTASAGNMAQGVAWTAREAGVACTVIVPNTAPSNKLAAIDRLGGRIISESYEVWWRVIDEHRYPGMDAVFIHPVADQAVITGNATIGLEILEDLTGADAVVVPWGGGGLTSGIAAAVKALKPGIKVYAAEVETAAPLAASLAAGAPQSVERRASFIDGMGGRSLLPEMWPLASSLVDGSIVVSVGQVTDAIRLLAETRGVLAEGAGAAAVAAAMTGGAGSGKIVCVVSGANIDADVLLGILNR